MGRHARPGNALVGGGSCHIWARYRYAVSSSHPIGRYSTLCGVPLSANLSCNRRMTLSRIGIRSTDSSKTKNKTCPAMGGGYAYAYVKKKANLTRGTHSYSDFSTPNCNNPTGFQYSSFSSNFLPVWGGSIAKIRLQSRYVLEKSIWVYQPENMYLIMCCTKYHTHPGLFAVMYTLASVPVICNFSFVRCDFPPPGLDTTRLRVHIRHKLLLWWAG